MSSNSIGGAADFSPGRIESMENQTIAITIESRIENVSLAGMVIGTLCAAAKLAEMDAYLVEVAVVEAVTNSIQHAYGNEPDHHVKIVFSLDIDGITIKVCDRGTPLDPQTLEQKKVSFLEVNTDDINSIPEGGRGLAIINEVMDRVEYKSDQEKNCMTMRKIIEIR